MSLVDVATYQRITGDRTTSAADAVAALGDAERAIAEHLRRVSDGRPAIAYGTYTEPLVVYANGRVYPAATPLDEVQTPADAIIDGNSVVVGFGSTTWHPLGSANLQGPTPAIAVTYTGGWQPAGVTDGPTGPLPIALVRAICQVAWQTAHPVQLSGVPAGAGNVAVGDVSISGATAGAGSSSLTSNLDIDPAIASSIAGYMRRDVLPQRTR
jgi:hypothetical protein